MGFDWFDVGKSLPEYKHKFLMDDRTRSVHNSPISLYITNIYGLLGGGGGDDSLGRMVFQRP